MGLNCNKSPQSYSKVTITLTVTNNNRPFVNFFVLFVIYGQNTMDNYVMMNARREVSKQLRKLRETYDVQRLFLKISL